MFPFAQHSHRGRSWWRRHLTFGLRKHMYLALTYISYWQKTLYCATQEGPSHCSRRSIMYRQIKFRASALTLLECVFIACPSSGIRLVLISWGITSRDSDRQRVLYQACLEQKHSELMGSILWQPSTQEYLAWHALQHSHHQVLVVPNLRWYLHAISHQEERVFGTEALTLPRYCSPHRAESQ